MAGLGRPLAHEAQFKRGFCRYGLLCTGLSPLPCRIHHYDRRGLPSTTDLSSRLGSSVVSRLSSTYGSNFISFCQNLNEIRVSTNHCHCHGRSIKATFQHPSTAYIFFTAPSDPTNTSAPRIFRARIPVHGTTPPMSSLPQPPSIARHRPFPKSYSHPES
jgi:hypothetical protein